LYFLAHSRLSSHALVSAPKSPAPMPPTPYAALRFANNIDPQPLRWLWPARIPYGKLTLLVGDPGVGKSLLTADLAARVSRGHPMPGPADRHCRPDSAPADPNCHLHPPPPHAHYPPHPRSSPVPSTPAPPPPPPPEPPPKAAWHPALTAANATLESICFLEGGPRRLTRTPFSPSAPSAPLRESASASHTEPPTPFVLPS